MDEPIISIAVGIMALTSALGIWSCHRSLVATNARIDSLVIRIDLVEDNVTYRDAAQKIRDRVAKLEGQILPGSNLTAAAIGEIHDHLNAIADAGVVDAKRIDSAEHRLDGVDHFLLTQPDRAAIADILHALAEAVEPDEPKVDDIAEILAAVRPASNVLAM